VKLSHTGQLENIVFDPNTSGHLAFISDDKTVRIWKPNNDSSDESEKPCCRKSWAKGITSDLRTPIPEQLAYSHEIKNLITHGKLTHYKKRLNYITFDPHIPGQLASALSDKTFRIWKHNNAGLYDYQELSGHTDWVLSIAFDPHTNGQLASSSIDKTVCIWKRNDDDGSYKLQKLTGHKSWVSSVTFDPFTPGQLVSASYDGTIRVWKRNDDDSYTFQKLAGHTDWIWSVAFDQRTPGQLASASRDKTIRIWTLPTPRLSLETMTTMCCLLKANQMKENAKKTYLKKLIESFVFKNVNDSYWFKNFAKKNKLRRIMKTNFFFTLLFSLPLCASQALLPSEVPSLKALATQQVAKKHLLQIRRYSCCR